MSTDHHSDEPHARVQELSALQQRVRALETDLKKREETEATLRASLAEEQAARAKAEATDAFKEVFLGILGHDLRNPLNTVLTTARLMTMRNELPPESHKRMERVVVAGLRMQRMIEQLLDLTRARLAGGIAVNQGPEQDVAAIVSKVVAEAREARADRVIEVRAAGEVRARVDAERFEQAVSDLVGNALMHGDPAKPITVTLESKPDGRDGKKDGVSLAVHNFGPAIDSELMPLLFDPFKRGQRPKSSRPVGLGLGLYITERIINAHGGALSVASTPDQGTRFEAFFPRGP